MQHKTKLLQGQIGQCQGQIAIGCQKRVAESREEECYLVFIERLAEVHISDIAW